MSLMQRLLRVSLLVFLNLKGLKAGSQGHSCPTGYVQTAPVSFDCSRSGAAQEARYLAPAGKTSAVFLLPAGIKDFEVSFKPDVPGSQVDWIVSLGTKQIVGPSAGVVDDDRRFGSDEGLQIHFSGSKVEPEKVAFKGTTLGPLTFQVRNDDLYPQLLHLVYRYAEVEDCRRARLASCKLYNAFAVQQAVVDWSFWLQDAYSESMEAAWKDLAGPMLEAPHGEQAVPRSKWSYVWDSWPSAKDQAVSSAEVFAYVSNRGPSVTRPNFESNAFRMKEVQELARRCSKKLIQTYGTPERAWQDLQSPAGQGHFVEQCAGSSTGRIAQIRKFLFGEQGDFSEAEFRLLWNELSPCPPKHYRQAPLVFTCMRGAGRARLTVPSRQTEKLADLPAGIVNLRIGALAKQDVDLMLFDPVDQTWIVRWHGGLLNKNKRSGTYAGVQLRFRGDDQKLSASYAEEFIEMTGTLDRPLTVEVNNFGKAAANVVITSSWERIEDCPIVPAGCAAFDEHRTRRAAQSFSSWMVSNYDSEEEAWKGLHRATGSLSTAESERVQAMAVPFHQWKGIWQAWPSHGMGGVPWQEAFHLIDKNRDDVISPSEFRHLFHLGTAQELVHDMFLEAAEHCLDASDCWKACSGKGQGLSRRQWGQLMHNYVVQGVLPGGDQACQRWQTMRPYTFTHPEQLETRSALGSAESLGIVMGSFTLLSRIWGEPSLTQAVFRTTTGSREPGLFAGLEGGQLVFTFGGLVSVCKTPYKVPADTWLEVAWIYDASLKEQRLWMNGEEMKACSGVDPFRGFGQQVVAGELPSANSRLARVRSLFVFPEALEPENIGATFAQMPLTSSATLSGRPSGEVKLGRAAKLGIDGGSFTAKLKLLQSEAMDGIILAAVGDSDPSHGLRLAVQSGSLQSVFLGQSCQAEAALPTGRWVQVALVFDAQRGVQRLFQDGKLAKMCQVSRIPATRLGKVDLWLGKGDADQSGWLGQARDLEVFAHSECAVNLQVGAKAKPNVDLPDLEESFSAVDVDRNGQVTMDEYLAGLGAVSLSLHNTEAAALLPSTSIPFQAPEAPEAFTTKPAPLVTAVPARPPAEHLWVPGPASASNIMLGTADHKPVKHEQGPVGPAGPVGPSKSLPLHPLKRDAPAAPLNPFASVALQTTSTRPTNPTTTKAFLAKTTANPLNPLNQDPPPAPLNPFASLVSPLRVSSTRPLTTTASLLATTVAPVAARESTVAPTASPAPASSQAVLPPSFTPIRLGIPGGLSVDPLMQAASHGHSTVGTTGTTGTTTTTSTKADTKGTKGLEQGLGSLFKPFGMFEEHEDGELHLQASKWHHLVLLSLAATATSVSSLAVVLWLRRVPPLLRPDMWGTWEGGEGGEMVRLVV